MKKLLVVPVLLAGLGSVKAQEVVSNNPDSGFRFFDRTTGREWRWYADKGRVRLWTDTYADMSGFESIGFLEAKRNSPTEPPSMQVAQQRGVLVKDRLDMQGGLWLYGGHWDIRNNVNVQRGAIGAGCFGDMGTQYATGTSAASIDFLDGNILFRTKSGLTPGNTFYWSTQAMTLNTDGNVGIGTTTPGAYKLAVEGTVGAREIRVTNAPWADFVFQPAYRLRPLTELERYIQTEGHLPEVPTTAQVTQGGNDLGKTDALLLQKVEELTLYLIEQNKQLQQLKTQNQELQLDNKRINGALLSLSGKTAGASPEECGSRK